MPVKPSTIVNNVYTIPNKENQILVKEFFEFIETSGPPNIQADMF